MISISTGLRAGILNQYGLSLYMNRGVFEVYTGAKPAVADMAPSGTLLGRVTDSGGAFTEGSSTNGCQLSQGNDGALRDDGNWLLVPSATGIIGWWRWRWFLEDPGTDDPYYPRIDGAYGDGLVLSSPSVAVGNNLNIAFYMNLVGE